MEEVKVSNETELVFRWSSKGSKSWNMVLNKFKSNATSKTESMS